MENKEEKGNSISSRLQDLLVYPQETLNTELKGWLDPMKEEDKANLAQSMIALANSGGGYIIVGFAEAGGTWKPAQPRPSNLDNYTQDIINGIAQRYAEPSFHCEVHHVPHPQDGTAFPVVVVPGDHRVPIRAKRDGPNHKHVQQHVYYIRRPGPVSESPQTGREWDELIRRCLMATKTDLLESIRGLLLGVPNEPTPEHQAEKRFESWVQESRSRWQSQVTDRFTDENPSPYSNGIWTVAYSVASDGQQSNLRQLLEILRNVQGHETGWPPWLVPDRQEIRPYAYEGNIECWLAEGRLGDAAHSDFWRASPAGTHYRE